MLLDSRFPNTTSGESDEPLPTAGCAETNIRAIATVHKELDNRPRSAKKLSVTVIAAPHSSWSHFQPVLRSDRIGLQGRCDIPESRRPTTSPERVCRVHGRWRQPQSHRS